MNTMNFFIAIDPGSSTVRAMIAQKTSHNLLEILRVEEIPSAGSIEEGSIVNSNDAAYILKNIVERMLNFCTQRKEEILTIDIGINACDLKSKRIKESYDFGYRRELTGATLSELENSVSDKFENSFGHVFAVIRQEFELDGETVADAEKRSCNKCTANYLLLHGKPETIKKIEEVIEEKVRIFSYGQLPLVSQQLGELITTADEKAEGCAVINFGAQTTSVLVYTDGFLRHLAVLPFGGQDITNDIAKTLGITSNNAETLKIKHAAALLSEIDETEQEMTVDAGNGKMVAIEEIIRISQARIDEIADIVCREIANAGYWGKLNAGLIITGNAARLRAMESLLAIKTGTKVRKGSLAKYLQPQPEGTEKKHDQVEYHNLLAILHSATKPNTKTETPPPSPPVVEKEPEAPVEEKPKGTIKNAQGRGPKKTSWGERVVKNLFSNEGEFES